MAVGSVGCKANREEMECLQSQLEDAGYRVVPFGQPADWIVVNTCTVTAEGDSDSRQMVRRAARAGGGRVLVTGCLAQRAPASFLDIPGVTLIAGNAEKPELLAWIDARSGTTGPARAGSIPEIRVPADPTASTFPPVGRGREGRRSRASLKVQDGCDAHCTYCIIPSVRGRSRSRPLEDCRRQAERIAASGYRELMLTGINTSQWGADLPGSPELPALVRALSRVPGIHRLRLNSLEPEWLTEARLEQLLSIDTLCRHFHLPLQSGEAGVLRRMGRPYDPELYRERVAAIRRRAPDAGIGADVLVGFPGEAEQEFSRTEELLSELGLSYLHVFRYSPRPGVAALRLGVPPDPATVRARAKQLRDLSAEMGARFRRRLLGSEAEVLPERERGPDLWEGWTSNYVRVRFEWRGPDPRELPPIRVRLTAELDRAVLRGDVIASTEANRPEGGSA